MPACPAEEYIRPELKLATLDETSLIKQITVYSAQVDYGNHKATGKRDCRSKNNLKDKLPVH